MTESGESLENLRGNRQISHYILREATRNPFTDISNTNRE